MFQVDWIDKKTLILSSFIYLFVSSLCALWIWYQAPDVEFNTKSELPTVLNRVSSPHFLSVKITDKLSQAEFLNLVDNVLADSSIEPTFTIQCGIAECVLELSSNKQEDKETLSNIIQRIIYLHDDMFVHKR